MIRKIQLVSDNICYGPMPEPEREVEQRLTVLSDGRVWLSRYRFGEGWPHKLAAKETMRIGKEKATEILSVIENVFTEGFVPDLVTDVGSWDLKITFEDGQVVPFEGSLFRDERIEEYGISGMIRQALGDSSVFAFDGGHAMNEWD